MRSIEDVVHDTYVLRCGRKYTFTTYIDTYNNSIYINDNIYISDIVCKCNRLDKCGYHYTPRQYFEDNPWLRESVRSFFFIGKTNERTPNATPTSTSARSSLRSLQSLLSILNSYFHSRKPIERPILVGSHSAEEFNGSGDAGCLSSGREGCRSITPSSE